MLWRIILLEKNKIFGRLIYWIDLLILIGLIVISDGGAYLLAMVSSADAKSVLASFFGWPSALESAASLAGAHSLGGILLIVLIGVITAREYSWRTFHLWLSRGVSRITLFTAKCIIILLATIALAITAFVVNGALTAALSLALNGSLHLDKLDVNKTILNFLLTIYALLPYISLTFMLTIISRSSALALSVGLAFTFVLESILITIAAFAGGTTAQILILLPLGLTDTLQSAINGDSASLTGLPVPTPLVAGIGIAVYTIVFTGIAFWRFQTQEFTD